MICRNHPEVDEGVRRCSRCEEPFCPDCVVTIHDRPFCAACKTEQLLDVRSGVDPMQPRYGTFGPRLGALALDGLIAFVPAIGLCMFIVSKGMTAMSADPGRGVWLVLGGYLPLFGLPLLYEALMLTMRNGQTVGKLAFRLRVVRPDGSRITAAQAWGRAAMRIALGCLLVIDFIPYFFTDEKTTLHDMVAGTRVIESA